MSLRVKARQLGGWGRSLMNKMSRTTKHNLERTIDKRTRRELRREADEQLKDPTA